MSPLPPSLTTLPIVEQYKTPGVGPASKKLKVILTDAGKHLALPIFTGRNRLRDTLGEVFGECRAEGWDGYQAKPIPHAALLEAYSLIDSFPVLTRIPDVVPESSGAFQLEWNMGGRKFLISVGGSGSIHYAGLLGGGDELHGMEKFVDTCPSVLRLVLNTYFGETAFVG